MLTLPQILLYCFSKSSHLIKKDIFTFIKMFFISAHFWKHYAQWNNCRINIFVTNTVFITLYIYNIVYQSAL